MKTLTIKDIRGLCPCYDPSKYLPEDWSGTVLDILDIKDCSFEDRLWVVSRFLSDRVNRLFAVYCARQAIALIENPDERSLEAIEVAERVALGKATREELAAAWAAARAAAGDASRYAAWAAAWAAAGAAARDAANSAARADFECYLRLLISDEEQEK